MFNIDHIFKELKQTIDKVEERYNHKLDKILKEIKHMSIELDNLTSQVKSNSDAVDSAVALINGIADRITAAGVDSNKLRALTDELKSKDDSLAAAVVANTPAQP